MPITPTEVEAFIHSSDLVDEFIAYIDSALGSTREKEYRHGDFSDYFFQIDCIGVLSSREKDELRQAYTNVGWAIVQAYTCERDPGKTTVRLFKMHNSKYTHRV